MSAGLTHVTGAPEEVNALNLSTSRLSDFIRQGFFGAD